MKIFYKIYKWLYYLWLIDLFKGLIVTGKHFFSKKITVRYPEEKTPTSPRFKGLHALLRYPNGKERCIGCKLCEAVCPAIAINMDTTINEDGNRSAGKYEINLFKCIYCGLCEEACPVDAIVQTNITDYHFENRGEHILTKEKLLRIGDQYENEIMKNKEQDAIFR